MLSLASRCTSVGLKPTAFVRTLTTAAAEGQMPSAPQPPAPEPFVPIVPADYKYQEMEHIDSGAFLVNYAEAPTADAESKPLKNAAHIDSILERVMNRDTKYLHEHEAYEVLAAAGVAIPEHVFHPLSDAIDTLAAKLDSGKKYVAKAMIPGCIHKTDVGGLAFSITKDTAADQVRAFADKFAAEGLDGVLFAEQLDFQKGGLGGGEMLLSAYEDPFFGPTVAFGVGGTQVEYAKDVFRPGKSTFFLPAFVDVASVAPQLAKFPLVEQLDGRVRGVKKTVDYDTELLPALSGIQQLVRHYSKHNPEARYVIEEIEINPMVAAKGRLFALDGVLAVRENENYHGTAAPLYTTDKPLENIDALLNARSVCVIGASAKNALNPCNVILSKFKSNAGTPNEAIYPFHMKEATLQGLPAVSSLDALMEARNGDPVDCLVVGVPAQAAHDVMKEAMEKHVAKSILIISGGFSETEGGKAMQESLDKVYAALPADKRPVINGPNTLGCSADGWDTVFVPSSKSSFTGRGAPNTAIICQSGAFMISRRSDMADVVAPRVSVSVGNQMDLSVTDFLDHMLQEEKYEDINTFGLYIEGFKDLDGIRLMKLISEAARRGKYVVLYKAGRTAAGQDATAGHTASIAGDFAMIAHMIEMAGGIVAENVVEFEQIMMTASMMGDEIRQTVHAKGPTAKVRVAGLSNAGFEKCAIADHLAEGGRADLVDYTEGGRAAVADIYTKNRIGTVVDIDRILDTTPMFTDKGYDELFRTLLSLPEVDMGLFSMVPETNNLHTLPPGWSEFDEDIARPDSIVQKICRIREATPKPFVVCVESGWKYEPMATLLNLHGVPCFRHSDEAAHVVSKIVNSIRM